MKKALLLAAIIGIVLNTSTIYAQCVQFINYPADTIGWTEGSDHPGTYQQAFYNQDTFVITTSSGGENNYIYSNFPVTLFGAASEFNASFDFRMDSLSSCSDGLTFWFFTSSLFGLGSTSHEGGSLGFPDTTVGFALAMHTTVCDNNICMKKINSDNFHFSVATGSGDTDICPYLSSEMFLTDSQWHHCIVNYDHGYITTSYDGGNVVLTGYSPIYGTGHFGFMATNGGGYTRKCLKNIQVCAGYGTPNVASDSFATYFNRLCNGPQIEVHSFTYSPALNVKVWYGDGAHDSLGFAPDMTGGGYVVISHTYAAAGNYTIHEVLYDGASAIDSLQFGYENVFCATLPVKFYYDYNGDCLMDSSDFYMTQPILTEVDSNGVAIDTVSATSGFYYSCNGSVGDVYAFRVIGTPGNIAASCPSTGIVYDSLVPGMFIYPVKYVAFNCTSGSTFDIAVNATIPVTGIHDEWGDIYLTNTYCDPVVGTLTLHYSSKYAGTPSQVDPTPLTIAGDSIVWDAGSLSALNASPVHLHYQVNFGVTTLTVGDTVNSYFYLTPTVGDSNTTNNCVIINDTVRAGCDPNEMSVTPSGCMPVTGLATPLQYTINFMNVGNDTAFNIYVMDTLSSNLDPSSLRIILATNTMNTVVYNAAGYNILKFDFPAINLVDSATCPQCSGGVIFNINTISGLDSGATVFNHAGVFFDDNAVVMTNTVENTVGGCTDSAVNNAIHTITNVHNTDIYPNPATTILFINSTDNINSVMISNLLGQTVFDRSYSIKQVQVDVSGFPAGVYFVKVNGSDVKKFVKE